MNLILLKSGDFISENIVCLSDFRFEHIKKTLKLRTNESVKIGLLDSKIGYGEIIDIDEETVKLRTDFYKQPPERNPAILFCALPRPKVFRRVLLNAATF
jgi:16S rRNA U1498 N3-methylase RsmE